MSETPKPGVGSVAWIDLTVPNAEEIRDFYAEIVGWKPEPVDMGGYSDFNMTDPDGGQPVVGVCHARGGNAYLPAQWLIYFMVADLDASLAQCVARGGKIVGSPRAMGPHSRYCVIEDPAGAVSVLFQGGGE
jgi:predicted enzyme related to lactoylglutathione lyase